MPLTPVSVEDIRALELNSSALGVSTRLLMENAGASVARLVAERVDAGSRVLVLAGKGGKAGDGFVAARHLLGMGFEVDVALLYPIELVKHPDAGYNLSILLRDGSARLFRWKGSIERSYDVVLDAMLGTGARGVLRDPILNAVRLANDIEAFKVAIDVPTGIDPEEGRVLGDAFRADITVTMHAPKKGLLGKAAKPYVGELIVADIGIPPKASRYFGPGDVAIRVKRRPKTSHKGMGGRVAIVGGSHEYVGAPWLAALGALAGGVDLVFLYTPSPVADHRFSPEVIVRPLEGDILDDRNAVEILENLERYDAIVVGPGLGLARETRDAAISIVEKTLELRKPLVVDADALKAIAQKGLKLGPDAVVTPHLGEASRLLGEEIQDTMDGRIEAALRLSEKLNATVLLKGWIDVVARGDKYRLNDTGVPEMSTGGTGDVLSGLTAAMLCRVGDPFNAAGVAAFVNGLAGEMSVKQGGRASPLDLVNYIPFIISRPLDAFSEVRASGNA